MFLLPKLSTLFFGAIFIFNASTLANAKVVSSQIQQNELQKPRYKTRSWKAEQLADAFFHLATKAVVGLATPLGPGLGYSLCTATRIQKNLFLTADHCDLPSEGNELWIFSLATKNQNNSGIYTLPGIDSFSKLFNEGENIKPLRKLKVSIEQIFCHQNKSQCKSLEESNLSGTKPDLKFFSLKTPFIFPGDSETSENAYPKINWVNETLKKPEDAFGINLPNSAVSAALPTSLLGFGYKWHLNFDDKKNLTMEKSSSPGFSTGNIASYFEGYSAQVPVYLTTSHKDNKPVLDNVVFQMQQESLIEKFKTLKPENQYLLAGSDNATLTVSEFKMSLNKEIQSQISESQKPLIQKELIRKIDMFFLSNTFKAEELSAFQEKALKNLPSVLSPAPVANLNRLQSLPLAGDSGAPLLTYDKEKLTVKGVASFISSDSKFSFWTPLTNPLSSETSGYVLYEFTQDPRWPIVNYAVYSKMTTEIFKSGNFSELCKRDDFKTDQGVCPL